MTDSKGPSTQGLLAAVSKLLRARRAVYALLTNAVSSIGNLAIAVAIARAAPLSELGKFGVAFSIYALVTGLSRSMVAESVLTQGDWQQQFRAASQRVSAIGIGAGAVTCIFGLTLHSDYLTVTGLALPGMVLYDYVKVVSMAVGQSLRALAQECIWTLIVAVLLVISSTHEISPIAIYASWAFAGMAIGVVHAQQLGCRLRPAWNSNKSDTRTSTSFGMDFIAGSGVAQMTSSALAITVGNAVVGSLRGASTLLGPITLVSATARSLLIPHLLAAKGLAPSVQKRRALRVSVTLVGLVLPLALVVVFLPDKFGHMALGSNWSFAEPLMPALAAELVFALASTVPFAGHRVARAGKRTLLIRVGMAPIRIASVVLASMAFGAQGAANALATLSFLACVIWWISYSKLVNETDVSKQ